MAEVTIKLKCKDCGASFEVNSGEQKFYAAQGWELPKRCKTCRARRKQERAERKKASR